MGLKPRMRPTPAIPPVDRPIYIVIYLTGAWFAAAIGTWVLGNVRLPYRNEQEASAMFLANLFVWWLILPVIGVRALRNWLIVQFGESNSHRGEG